MFKNAKKSGLKVTNSADFGDPKPRDSREATAKAEATATADPSSDENRPLSG